MKTTIILNSEFLGRGNDEVGKTLIGSFLRKLWMLDKKPDTIIFYNTAVKLLITGSSVLDALHALAKAGVDLVACATCVEYFNLYDKINVGRIIDMQEIVSILSKSDKIITP